MFMVIILEQKHKLVVPEKWCKIIDKDFALIFNSQNKDAPANFENIYQNFHIHEDRAYYGYVLNKFGEYLKFYFHIANHL